MAGPPFQLSVPEYSKGIFNGPKCEPPTPGTQSGISTEIPLTAEIKLLIDALIPAITPSKILWIGITIPSKI